MNVPPDFGVDDTALIDVTVPNDLRAVRVPEARILTELRRCGYDDDTVFAIKLAFEEAVTNAVKHGNCNDLSKHVNLRYYVDPQRVILMIRDEGCGFCPDEVPDPTADENLERPSGRGLMLMQSYMTEVRFSATGNEVWLLKLRPGPLSPSESPPGPPARTGAPPNARPAASASTGPAAAPPADPSTPPSGASPAP